MSPQQYLEENAQRRSNLDVEYDPLRGIGSPLERFELVVGEGYASLFLPVEMKQHGGVRAALEAGSLAAFAEGHGKTIEEALRGLHIARCKYDFEFWCASIAKIKNKQGEIVPFVLNPPQRLYAAHLEEQRLAGKPVRAIVLKHRQWGCTTLSYTYIAWHQIEKYRGRDAWFVGLDKDGAQDVIGRYDTIREHYRIGQLSIRPYARMQNTRIIPERGSTLSAGTVKRPNAPSGRTPQFAHLFEIGKWPSNQVHSAEKVVSNVDSMLVDEPGTVGIIESTMQGDTGTYFKELCDRAREGESAYDFLFVSWTDDPQYQKPIDDKSLAGIERFVESWSEYHAFLWEHGCTLEQIRWYQNQERKPGFITEPWRLKEEFPTTADEAFQVGERRVFPAIYVQPLRSSCRDPLAVGELHGEGLTGKSALEGIEFVPSAHGPLKIWRRPGDTYGGLLEDTRYVNRYAAASDVGPGQSADADYSVTAVLDRGPMLFGGLPEIVAEWRGHEDVDLYAWKAARLAAWYQRAYWLIEANTPEAEKEMDERMPDYGETVLNEIKNHYGNLYMRQKYNNVKDEVEWVAGFYTTTKSKPIIIGDLTKALRGFKAYQDEDDPELAALGYIEREYGATKEMDHFLHIKGKMKAAPKKKDDRVMVRAFLAHLHSEMPPPRKAEKGSRPRARPKGAAAI